MITKKTALLFPEGSKFIATLITNEITNYKEHGLTSEADSS
jgi:hypothetical protein